ncbi:Aste57867_19019 [Aphanomyces stellatus]|uniref:Aste57867_19019 protein n=1 Tax=Aphanomyces stellatus TaxID=120398 RepID=A0A485LBS0_9STRA|nr:hypothetical protein As57867_018955 [Aphanomyces stellatus]VFT95744.1 Aste57867_19019 [Aphanomyces stellatus]
MHRAVMSTDSLPLLVTWLATWHMPYHASRHLWPHRHNAAILHTPPARFLGPALVYMGCGVLRPLLGLLPVPCGVHLTWSVTLVATSACSLLLEASFLATVTATNLLVRLATWREGHTKAMARCRRFLHRPLQAALLAACAPLVAALLGLGLTLCDSNPSTPTVCDRASDIVVPFGLVLGLALLSSLLLRSHPTTDYYGLRKSLTAKTYVVVTAVTLVLMLHVAADVAAVVLDPRYRVADVVATLLPTYLYYAHVTTHVKLVRCLPRRRSSSSARSQSESLAMFRAFLDTHDGWLAFQSYSYLELRLEELLAWQLCRNFEQAKTHSLFAAQQVYAHCLAPHGALGTATAAAWRAAYDRRLHKVAPLEVAPDAFAPFAHALLHVMYTQVFPRYLLHPFGKSWKWFAVRYVVKGGKRKKKRKVSVETKKHLAAHLLTRSITEESSLQITMVEQIEDSLVSVVSS